MKSLLRSIVASPNQSFTDVTSNITFDLTYITSSLIVSSGPTTSFIKNFYRYPVQDLVTILNINHGTNWQIYNLRGEGPGYEANDVYYKWKYYPFPDHQPPSFKLLLTIVQSINHYLSQNDNNIALIHCKAGKGRSGTIACAYLMYQSYLHHLSEPQHDITTVNAINKLYSDKRMRFGQGVTIKSQLRYLDYWYRYLVNGSHFDFDIIPAITLSITLKNGVQYLTDDIKHLNLSIDIQGYKSRPDIIDGVAQIDLQLVNSDEMQIIDDDIVVANMTIQVQDVRICINKFLYCWFNIYFEDHQFNITFEDMDGFKGTSVKGIKLFDKLEISYNF